MWPKLAGKLAASWPVFGLLSVRTLLLYVCMHTSACRKPARKQEGEQVKTATLLRRFLGPVLIGATAVIPQSAQADNGGPPSAQSVAQQAQGPINVPQTTAPPGVYVHHPPGTQGTPHVYHDRAWYAAQQAVSQLSTTATTSCPSNFNGGDCYRLNYHNSGRVLQAGTYAFNIFWQPYNPTSYNWFDWRLNTYFSDINGTGYYGNLTQYYQLSPNNVLRIHPESFSIGRKLARHIHALSE